MGDNQNQEWHCTRRRIEPSLSNSLYHKQTFQRIINLDIKEIKQVVEIMKRSNLTEFEIEEKDLKLRICRQGGTSGVPQIPAEMPAPGQYPITLYNPGAQTPTQPQAVPHELTREKGEGTEDPNIVYITSPMVGTFYRSSSPDSEPFIEEGKKVNADTVVCIIEAMKVMNEIQAEQAGVVLEVLVENGDPVEYNQPLFKLRVG